MDVEEANEHLSIHEIDTSTCEETIENYYNNFGYIHLVNVDLTENAEYWGLAFVEQKMIIYDDLESFTTQNGEKITAVKSTMDEAIELVKKFNNDINNEILKTAAKEKINQMALEFTAYTKALKEEEENWGISLNNLNIFKDKALELTIQAHESLLAQYEIALKSESRNQPLEEDEDEMGEDEPEENGQQEEENGQQEEENGQQQEEEEMVVEVEPQIDHDEPLSEVEFCSIMNSELNYIIKRITQRQEILKVQRAGEEELKVAFAALKNLQM